MAERANRRRRANIRARVSSREKALLIERKRAVGARTWRDFMFGVAAPRGATAVDLSKVALLTTSIAALQEAPRGLRSARKDLMGAVDALVRLSILNPERAELHRLGIESALRDVRALITQLDRMIEQSEIDAAPARDEIARILRLITGR